MEPSAPSPFLHGTSSDADLDALYRAVSPFIVRFLRTLQVPACDEEDLAQDVRLRIFRAALQGLPHEHAVCRWFRGEADAPEHVRRWVGAIAVHVVGNYRGRACRRYEQFSPQGQIHGVAHDPSPARQAIDAERCKIVVDALGELAPERREVLVRYYFAGHSTHEIAQQLAIAEGTVFSRLRYAREDMRAILRRRLGEHLQLILGFEDAAADACAFSGDIDGDPAHQDTGFRDAAWLGLLAVLLLLGRHGRAIPVGNAQARAEPRAGPRMAGTDRSASRPRSLALLTVPCVLLSSLFLEPCNGPIDVAHTVPKARGTPAISAGLARELPRPDSGEHEPRLPPQQADAASARALPGAEIARRPDTGPEAETEAELLPRRDFEASVVENREGLEFPWPSLFHLPLSNPASKSAMRQPKSAALIPPMMAPSRTYEAPAAPPPPCVPGQTISCYSGPQGTEGIGICRAGTSTCLQDGTGWGACEAEVTPGIENCVAPEDEDCNGESTACSGEELWNRWFGAPKGVAVGIIYGADGSIVLTGSFAGTIDFSGKILTGNGGDVFVTKLDQAGNLLWAQRFGGGDRDTARGIAVDTAGNIFITGVAGEREYFPGHLFLTSFDSAGTLRWSKIFTPTTGHGEYLVAADSLGNAVLGLSFSRQLDFGGGPMVSANAAIALAKFDAAGNYLWSKHFDDGLGTQRLTSLAVDSSGDILIAGAFTGAIDFGGTLFTSWGQDAFVVKVDGSGQHLWSKQFGSGVQEQSADGVAVDSAGNVLVSGKFSGSIDLGAGAILSAGRKDIFIAKLAPSGEYLWGRTFGDANDQSGNGEADHTIALDAADNIMWTDAFGGTVNFGGLPLVADDFPARTSFLVKLDPSGNHVWSKRFGAVITRAIGSDGAGSAVIAGEFIHAFGAGGASTSVAGRGISLVRVAP